MSIDDTGAAGNAGAVHEMTAYEAITEDNDQERWAFGTGFRDPLDGVDTSIPSGVDGVELAAYCVMLGDDALVASHRLQEWVSRAPELEDEVALANIALDLLGQARLLLTRTGASDEGRSEDELAFTRAEHEFRNVRLVESPHRDFAEAVATVLVLSTWRLAVAARLRSSADPVLAAIAGKAVPELTYHRDYAAGWVVRLGDGTSLSHERMQRALDDLWPLVDELFTCHPVESRLVAVGVAVDPAAVRAEFDDVLATVCAEATLRVPDVAPRGAVSGRTGRDGVHTETMGYLLAELQSLPRVMPGATW